MNCANHPDRERVAFCQNCGKPLCSECSRTVGNAVFCEPCLAARLAAADATTSTGYAATAPVSPLPGAPNPALAGLLGLIPGVGAMYNGQYAKGVVHLIVFAVLVSLSDSHGLFGLFVAGWVFYQVIEAHHTARARRDGTPLPNPFGLNDIGEKLGFGRSWPSPATPAPDAGATYTASDATRFTQDASGNISYTGGDGSQFTQSATGARSYTGPGAFATPNWGAPPVGGYAYAVPPTPPYETPFPVDDSLPPNDRSRFPIGALLLIGLGLLFFIGSTGMFHHFPIQRILPFILIATGVWIFVRKMTCSGLGMADDGTPAYRLRLFRALRGAIWVILVGVLFLLDTFDILSWAHSWPLFIIVAGLMQVFSLSAYRSAAPPVSYPYPPAGPDTPYPPAQPTSNAIVPTTQHDEEGR